MRDYIRKNLSEPVSFVQIAVTKEEYVERAMPRVRDFCKATGNTEEQAWTAWGCDAIHGEFAEGCWAKVFLSSDPFLVFEDLTEEEKQKDSFFIDSGKACAGTIPGLESALGLSHIETVDLDAIKQINVQRVGANLSGKEGLWEAWRDECESQLAKTKFLAGDEVSELDWKYSHMIEKPMQGIKVEACKEDKHPKLFAWKETMAPMTKEKFNL